MIAEGNAKSQSLVRGGEGKAQHMTTHWLGTSRVGDAIIQATNKFARATRQETTIFCDGQRHLHQQAPLRRLLTSTIPCLDDLQQGEESLFPAISSVSVADMYMMRSRNGGSVRPTKQSVETSTSTSLYRRIYSMVLKRAGSFRLSIGME